MVAHWPVVPPSAFVAVRNWPRTVGARVRGQMDQEGTRFHTLLLRTRKSPAW